MKLKWSEDPWDAVWPGARLLVVEDEEMTEGEATDPISDRGHMLVMPRVGLTLLSNFYLPVRLRGRGLGRCMMRHALESMCPVLTPVYLTALPFGAEPMPMERLMEWYAGMGFESVPGHEFVMFLEGPEKAAIFQ
jgi:hypothetical protein